MRIIAAIALVATLATPLAAVQIMKMLDTPGHSPRIGAMQE